MNTLVKRAKSAALGKKFDQSRGSAKHRERPFPPQRDHLVPKRTL